MFFVRWPHESNFEDKSYNWPNGQRDVRMRPITNRLASEQNTWLLNFYEPKARIIWFVRPKRPSANWSGRFPRLIWPASALVQSSAREFLRLPGRLRPVNGSSRSACSRPLSSILSNRGWRMRRSCSAGPELDQRSSSHSLWRQSPAVSPHFVTPNWPQWFRFPVRPTPTPTPRSVK